MLVPYNRRNQGRNLRRNYVDIDSIFNDFFNNDSFFSSLDNGNMNVDVKENGDEYIVDVDLPGIDKDAINVELRDNRLTIAVERNEVQEDNRSNYIRKERRATSMARSFLVDNVKREDVKAEFNNGVLTITLPKSEATRPDSHRIDIQ